MKLPIVDKWMRMAAVVLLTALAVVEGQAQDYALAAAVTANGSTIKNEVGRTNNIQSGTLAENATINMYLNQIRNYEQKMQNYLSTATGVVRSAYGIMKCLKLSTDIVNNLGDCAEAARRHPEGIIISAIVSNQYTDIMAESASLVGYLTPIVQGGGENNLLNSTERLAVLNMVQSKLFNINNRLTRLKYDILYSHWSHIPRKLVPGVYYGFLSTEAAYRQFKWELDLLKSTL